MRGPARHILLGERVGEVKSFLEELQVLMKEKLEAGAAGMDTLGRLLESLSEAAGQNAGVGQDLKEMLGAMKGEFEETRSSVVGAKLDTDEKFQQTTDVLGAKIDEKIAELVAKYDGVQAAIEGRQAAGEARGDEM